MSAADVFARAREHVDLIEAPTEDGLRFLVDTRDSGQGRSLVAGGGAPRALLRALALVNEAGAHAAAQPRVIVEAGAGAGVIALRAVARHGFEAAVACEPEPRNARLLRANAVLNGLEDRVRVLEVALSDERGEEPLVLSETDACGHRLPAAHSRRDRGTRLAVGVETLDTLAARGLVPARIGLLWIDVGGHEGHVLAGAGKLLEALPPLVVRLEPRALELAGGLDSFLAAAGRYARAADLREESGTLLPPLRPASAIDDLVGRLRLATTDAAATELLLLDGP